MDKLERETKLHALQQKTYIPMFSQEETRDEHALRCIPLATRANPKQLRGQAHRIGYLGDHALYRLKVRYGPNNKDVLTLPDVFIVDGETFRPLSFTGKQ